MSNRKDIYSEAEVGAIIRRAIEVQESSTAEDYTPGVTREELERIAKEMGISVSAIEKAMSEVRKLEPEKRNWFSIKTEIERVIDGELDPNNFDLVASELPTMNSQIVPTQIGRTLSARVQSGWATSQVSVTSRKGRTKVKVESVPVMPLVFGGQAALWAIISGCIGMFSQNGNPLVGTILFFTLLALASWLLIGGTKACRKSSLKLAEKLTAAVEDTMESSEQTEMRDQLAKPQTPSSTEDGVSQTAAEEPTKD